MLNKLNSNSGHHFQNGYEYIALMVVSHYSETLNSYALINSVCFYCGLNFSHAEFIVRDVI